MPASEITNTDVPLEFLWGRTTVERLREQLLAALSPDNALDRLEAGLLSVWKDQVSHPAVAFALRRFRATPSLARIQTVTDATGLSPKRFIERFKTEVGVTPKQYCRLLRFQCAVQLTYKREVNWAQLALDCGYFDQAHFIHEFREFSGLTPCGYQTACTEFQNHVNFLQSP
jgi:AraC-like DNA-binding protein